MTFLDTIGADAPGDDDLPPFLKSEQKHELAGSQHPFWVIGGVPTREGKFEPQTFYTIKFGKVGRVVKTQAGDAITVTTPGWSADAEAWTLALSVDDKGERPKQVTKILEALAMPDAAPGIGPCFLHGIPTKSGNTFWKVRGVRDEAPPTLTPPTANGGGSKPADDDSSIPFAMSWI